MFVPNIHTMQPARVGVCQSSSDSAEAQTETKLHNVTNGEQKSERGRVRVHVRACVRVGGKGTRMEEPTEKARESERVEKKSREGQKKRGWDIHHALTNSASVARVRVRAHTSVRECVQRSVSSRRAWNGRERRAVSAPHPERNPL